MKKFRAQQQVVCHIIVQNQTVLDLSGRKTYNSFPLNEQSTLVKHKQLDREHATYFNGTNTAGKMIQKKSPVIFCNALQPYIRFPTPVTAQE